MIKGLYALTPRQFLDSADLVARTGQIIAGGARYVLYRDLESSLQIRTRQALTLLELCEQHDSELLILEDIHLAASIGAAGVHLEEHDSHVTKARRLLGDNALIGVSCNASMRSAVQAQSHGANYVTFGSLYATKHKPLAKLAPLSLIQSASEMLDVSIVAIGGITHDNVVPVIDAGADAVAITAMYNTPKCLQDARTYADLFIPSESIGEKNVD